MLLQAIAADVKIRAGTRLAGGVLAHKRSRPAGYFMPRSCQAVALRQRARMFCGFMASALLQS